MREAAIVQRYEEALARVRYESQTTSQVFEQSRIKAQASLEEVRQRSRELIEQCNAKLLERDSQLARLTDQMHAQRKELIQLQGAQKPSLTPSSTTVSRRVSTGKDKQQGSSPSKAL